MHMEKWDFRLLLSESQTGPWNMAIDEGIMNHIGAGDSPPTIRLYRWHPACLSLGLAQPVSDVNGLNLKKLGWDLVRRPTGGRAILHTDELTYAVIASAKHPLMAGSLLESYQRISQALLYAMHLLGVPAVATPEEQVQTRQQPKPICFEVPSNYEITCNGKKLIGSAQSRRNDAILQHGAIPISGDISRIVLALSATSQENEDNLRNKVLQRATTIKSILNRVISWEACSQAVISGFNSIGINFIPGELSELETLSIKQLHAEKYANSEWTNRI